MKILPNFSEEKRLWKANFKHLAGVDEAGRGPLAGPVVVAGVILPPNFKNERLNDSKKMSAFQREQLFEIIIDQAVTYTIEVISPKKIDQVNIYEATRLGMRRCIKKMEPKPDFVLLDAVNINLPEIPQKAIIKGDAKVLSIAAASVLAKVYRDRLMSNYAQKYPQYGFERHMGYGTSAHLEALKKHGPCPIHRRSFAPVREAEKAQLIGNV